MLSRRYSSAHLSPERRDDDFLAVGFEDLGSETPSAFSRRCAALGARRDQVSQIRSMHAPPAERTC